MSDGLRGYQDPASAASEFNALTFLAGSLINRIATTTLVKVMGVTNSGGLAAVGYVDILPLVNQLDGAGVSIKHGTIYKCPYFRLQGGSNAVILDPKVGDIGIALFADRDISSVSATKAQANPGSGRRFDMADGLYIGGVLNGTPNQYIQFNDSGISINSPQSVKLIAPDVQISATTMEINASVSVTVTTPNFKVNGALQTTGTATLASMTSTGAANFSAAVNINGKNIGSGHTHNLTGGGHTLDVT